MEVDEITIYKEFEKKIHYNLTKMQRNLHMEVILEEILWEIWNNDDSDFEWKPEPSIKLDDKYIINPEFRRVLQMQKDILWKKLSNNNF